jgi:predicted amidohydrolase YtcJ
MKVGNGNCLLTGGTIYTMDPQRPRSESLVIRGGRIVYAGNEGGARAFKGPHTEVIDLHGRTALPGFIESHSHPYHVGLWTGRRWVNCQDFRSIDEILSSLRARAREVSPDQWILAYRYDETKLNEKRHPTRHDLDPFFPQQPVFIYHLTQHIIAVNTPVLRIAGITSSTPDPAGGKIDRDEHGEPTGVFRETAAMHLARTHLPIYSEGEIFSCLEDAAQIYLFAGVTSVLEGFLGKLGGMKEAQALAKIARAGGLSVRYQTAIPYLMWKELHAGAEPGLDWGGDSEWVRPIAVKLFQDGALFSSAALSEPSRGQTKTGDQYFFWPQAELDRMVQDAHINGWQVMIHANGDVAIQSVLDAYEHALDAKRRADHRHCIIHCQLATDNQLDRMARLGVVATFFPAHIWHWGDRHLANLGPQRAARLSPMASALKRGIQFGLHNDSPFTPVEPLVTMCAAVTRRAGTGEILGSEESISVDQALKAYTLGAAYVLFDEGIKGSLEEGKVGDVVVLEADPYRVTAEEIKDIPVAMTIVGGRVAYTKE